MLAVFQKSVANSPDALLQQNPPTESNVSALKDGFLANHFSSLHSGSVVVNLASSGFMAYSSKTDSLLLPRLSDLSDLDMSMNKLSGPIPAAFGKMAILVTLNLNVNLFTDPIPASLMMISLAPQ